MKYLVAVIALGLIVTGCKPGQRLGVFKQNCAELKGKLEQLKGDEYKCTLLDGKVLYSR